MAEAPRIYEVNGYGVFEIRPGPVFKVYDSDRQYGEDFTSFEEAADFARTLPRRLPPQG